MDLDLDADMKLVIDSDLDLPRRELIYEILSDTLSMDQQALRQAMQVYNGKLHVFTAPADILPLDMIGPDNIEALIALTKQCFDIVIIDMPTALTSWTDTVLKMVDEYFDSYFGKFY